MRRFAAAALLLAACAIAAPAASLGPDGEAGVRLPGKAIWLDLATEDPASARAFYGAVFGWTFREEAGAYAIAENGSGKVAGVFRHASPRPAALRARWLALISVPDAEQAARVVRERGGEVLVAPCAVAGRGTHAVFRDPDGAVFGVLQAEAGSRAKRSSQKRSPAASARCFRPTASRAPASRSCVPRPERPAGCRTSSSTTCLPRCGARRKPADASCSLRAGSCSMETSPSSQTGRAA